MENGLTKEHSKMLYGFAILTMLYHHLFFPDRLNCKYTSIFGPFYLDTVWFTKICVAIYAFISGYAIYKKCHSSNPLDNPLQTIIAYYKTVAKQLIGFFKKFWLVFAIFIPLGFILGKLPSFNATTFFSSLFGLSNAYASEWWYVTQYLFMLLLSPFICFIGDVVKKNFEGRNQLLPLLITLLICVYVSYASKFLGIMSEYTFVFCLGYLVANYGIYKRIDFFSKHRVLHLLFCLILLVACVLFRYFLLKYFYHFLIDIFIIIPFIYAFTVLIEHIPPIFFLLQKLGKYSVYMWLTHGFFCYYYFQEIIIISGIPIVFYLTLFGLTLATAILLRLIEWGLEKLFGLLKDKFYKKATI